MRSHMSEHAVQRPRHLRQIQRIDEEACVPDLAAATAAHEASQLVLRSPSQPRRLLLQSAEGSKVTVGVEDFFHGSGAKTADQLVLQVLDTTKKPSASMSSRLRLEPRPARSSPRRKSP